MKKNGDDELSPIHVHTCMTRSITTPSQKGIYKEEGKGEGDVYNRGVGIGVVLEVGQSLGGLR